MPDFQNKNIEICFDERSAQIVSKSKLIDIDYNIAKIIDLLLSKRDVSISSDAIRINSPIEWNSTNSLTIISKKDILISSNATIKSKRMGSIILKAGIENKNQSGRVIFEGDKQIINNDDSKVYIYYNPQKDIYDHKYHNPHPYFKHIKNKNSLTAYMLINNVENLQDINLYLHGNYALSSNIDASETALWDGGMGFDPIMNRARNMPFSGKFDGNNYKISNLYINRPTTNDVGMFGQISGQETSPCLIQNLNLANTTLIGDHYVGILVGDAQYCNISNIHIDGYNLNARAVVGGLIGTSSFVNLRDTYAENGKIDAQECQGFLIGSSQYTEKSYDESQCMGNCTGYDLDISFNLVGISPWAPLSIIPVMT